MREWVKNDILYDCFAKVFFNMLFKIIRFLYWHTLCNNFKLSLVGAGVS